MKRRVIEIEERLCDGCGLCVPGCPEGAIRIVDGKARVVAESFCDGLGACLGTCPRGAIRVVEKEAEPYDERKVMEERIIPQGDDAIASHLRHLAEHGETALWETAIAVLGGHNIPLPDPSASLPDPMSHPPSGCPGNRAVSFRKVPTRPEEDGGVRSRLTNWPIQLALLNPESPYLRGADLLVAADCTAFACGDFHRRHLEGKVLTVLCPKLDPMTDIYRRKLTAIVSRQGIRSVTVVRMEVPCCGGITRLVQEALRVSGRDIPFREVVLPIQES